MARTLIDARLAEVTGGMLAYVSGALLNVANLDESRARYEQFAAACAEAGWEAYVPHQHADPERNAQMENVDVARRDLEAVTRADVLIAYVGEPSLGVGAEVAIALAAKKPVLMLAEADRKVSRFLLGLVELESTPVRVCRYTTLDEACAWIARTLGAIQPT